MEAVFTVSVEVPDPVTEVGLNVPVAPVGRPLTVNPTGALKPFTAVTEGVYVVLEPCTTVCEVGEEESVKSGPATALTTSVEVAVCVSVPLVPVNVSVYVPAGVVADVVTVSVEVPDPVTEEGLNVPVAPVGKPLTLNATTPLKPFAAAAAAVYIVLPPWVTLCDAGKDASAKSGEGVMPE